MFDKSLIDERRYTSALKKDLTPVRIDRENKSAIFVGSEGNLYETDLDRCSCVDFAINGYAQPCKHMLRLAMELAEIPADGMQADVESARAKYYLGKAKQFIHDAPIIDVIQFAKGYAATLAGGKNVKDDVFLQSMDLNTLSDAPMFKVQKNGSVKVEKQWKKEWDNILTILRNRFGNEVIYRLGDSEFVSALCKGG